MHNRRKICVVTGSRAEYGQLYWLLKKIQAEKSFRLQLVVTGMHLSPEFGLTVESIVDDGFAIDDRVEVLLSSDTPIGISKSIGLGVIGFAEVFGRIEPDLLLLLGDRFEVFAAAQAGLLSRIPIAHIAGGDTTVGAFDEAIRHCITKMSHLHFVTNADSFGRLCQLGENPEHVFNVGNPGLDQIRNLQVIKKKDLESILEFKLRKKNALITFHPATLDDSPPEKQFREVLKALKSFGGDLGLIFTMPNADPGGKEIGRMINQFVKDNVNAKSYVSLGQRVYLNVMSYVDVVVGNSSSGIYEAPSFGKPTVNIGDRQIGRLLANSVITCRPGKREIINSIRRALVGDFSNVSNPYGEGDISQKIIDTLKGIPDYKSLIKKKFFDFGRGHDSQKS